MQRLRTFEIGIKFEGIRRIFWSPTRIVLKNRKKLKGTIKARSITDAQRILTEKRGVPAQVLRLRTLKQIGGM